MELDRIQSVKLFLESAGKRDVNAKEVFDLIEEYPILNLEEMFPNLDYQKQEEMLTLAELNKSDLTRI